MTTVGIHGPKAIDTDERNLLTMAGRLLAYADYELVAPKTPNATTQAVIEGFAAAKGKKLVRLDEGQKVGENVAKLIIYEPNPEAFARLADAVPENAPTTIWLTSAERLQLFVESGYAILDEDGKLPKRP